MRLQKYMALCGVASRRRSEALMAEGHVTVNGVIAREMGTVVNPETDIICVHGKVIHPEEEKIVVLFNKPVGVVSTASDPEGRKTVLDCIKDIHVRLYPVGRLDYDTEGLLLLTNDGELAHHMTHPRFGMEKTYHAVVAGKVTEESMYALRHGVVLDDQKTSPAKASILENNEKTTMLQMTIHEGRNRQIRRMLELLGYRVIALRRVQIGPLTLSGLKVGEWRILNNQEVSQLQSRFL